MISRRPTTLLLAILLVVFAINSLAQAVEPLFSVAGGSGTYYPAQGYFNGPGNDQDDADVELGPQIYAGRLELGEPTDEFGLVFPFQNFGRGTEDEILERNIYNDGEIFLRIKGVVQLIPYNTDPSDLDPDFDSFNPELGPFTAEWEGDWDIVKGTGRYVGAKGSFVVTAINQPFLLTDTSWPFDWTWQGSIELKKGMKTD